jgi:biotin carboxyl carrier protein
MMKQVQFEIDGKLVTGTVALHRGTLWAHVDGRTFSVESQGRTKRGGKASGAGSANPGEIAAPMPGKIIKVMVKPGTNVAAGEVVIVMEAMKMEYTLKASAPGQVSEIFCAPGEQVPLGQVLAKLDVK